jgi:hypothetical protein
MNVAWMEISKSGAPRVVALASTPDESVELVMNYLRGVDLDEGRQGDIADAHREATHAAYRSREPRRIESVQVTIEHREGREIVLYAHAV